jgi:hypothetical protein
MTSNFRWLILSILIATVLPACGFVHDEKIDGPYHLVAIDVNEQMDVCYEIKDACVERIGATVFAVGHNESYIVAARHPSNTRTGTQYFYLVRSLDGPTADPASSVHGPFDAAEFESERARLSLPPFDVEMAGLK